MRVSADAARMAAYLIGTCELPSSEIEAMLNQLEKDATASHVNEASSSDPKSPT
jgi:hypothetical protein